MGAQLVGKRTLYRGATPLHLVAAVKALVQLSADIETKADDGDTPLHLAAGKGHVEALKTLVPLSAGW